MASPEVEAVQRRGHELLVSVSKQLLNLSAREYPTDSPKAFIEYMESIVQGLALVLNETVNVTTANYIIRFAKDFGSHLRFLDAASAPRVPWALIGPMERTILDIIPGSKLVLRAQWQYNYKIMAISESYRTALAALPAKHFGRVYANPPEIWNIVSLPTIDRTNSLMHVLLGHEAGHRVAERFLKSEDLATLQREIASLVGDAVWYNPQVGSYPPLAVVKVKAEAADLLITLRTRGLKELISDVVGMHVFGPSFLFALREMSLESPLDTRPSAPAYYPPWRYRYRLAYAEYERRRFDQEIASLKREGMVGIVRHKVLNHTAALRAISEATTDLDQIRASEATKRAYGSIDTALPKARAFIDTELTSHRYSPQDFKAQMQELLERLGIGVPPAETRVGGVTFRDVILAGWLYRIARLNIPTEEGREWDAEDDLTLQRLVHKAMEYADTSANYAAWKAAGPTP